MSGEQAVMAEALLKGLLNEYGEDAETWTAMRSLDRITSAVLAALATATPARLSDEERETLILAVAHGFHDFVGGHPDYPDYDEVACGGSPEYHCEAGHEHGSRGVCWACEPPSAHIVDTVLAPLLAARAVQPTPPAQAEAVAAVIAAIEAIHPPYNYELRYDGSEDPTAAAYVEAFREVDNVLDQFRAPTAADQVAAMRNVADHAARVVADVEGRRE